MEDKKEKPKKYGFATIPPSIYKGREENEIRLVKVFKRDGWKCQLCGKKLKPKDRGKFIDNAPELDHIIPWAKGGEHSYRNTQCTCRKCNGDKNDKELGQLRMFG